VAASSVDVRAASSLSAQWEHRGLAIAWPGLGITAPALAGVFAILLVLASTPGLSDLFPTVDFFRTALVVQVDQSVLIWFLAFAGLLGTLCCGAIPALSWPAFTLAAAGCLLVGAAPFLGAADPLLNNYVPVLQQPPFLSGLLIFGIGILAQMLAVLARAPGRLSWAAPLGVGAATATAAVLIAALALAWTWHGLSPRWQGKAYYEYLFWAPGHALQFVYTQVMLVAWLWIAASVGRPVPLSGRSVSALLVLGVLPLCLVPVILGLYAPDSAQARVGFTRLMQFGNGLAAIPLGLLVAWTLTRGRGLRVSPNQQPAYRALVASLVLFAVGGVLAGLITGVNTIIPAHYHGSIVGITLALMGLTYLLLPRLGFGEPAGRVARWQPIVYGAGQLLHISGLAVSGAMGAARKTAGAAQGLRGIWENTAMGVMGLGGLLAVVGGILFVVVVLEAFASRADG
jgi:cytochrome c oxidase subunit 1